MILKACRILTSSIHGKELSERKAIFQKAFNKKSRYVQFSEPIIDVQKIMGYMTRYMYRAPVAVSKIISSNLIP